MKEREWESFREGVRDRDSVGAGVCVYECVCVGVGV